jgi:hypothetical protein
LRRFGGGRPGRREEVASDFEPVSIGGAEESRVAHLGESLRQDVVEEAGDKFVCQERGGLELAGTVVAVAEAHRAVVIETVEAAVGDGDAEEVAAEVVENFLIAPGGFAVDDPVFVPGGFGNQSEQGGLFEAVAELAVGQREKHEAALSSTPGRFCRFGSSEV